MPEKDYTISLTDEDKVRIRFISQGKKVTYFVVQYYANIYGKWKTIMRADNCHGGPHLHVYYLHSKEYRLLLNKENGPALNAVKTNVEKNYLKIKENFLNN